MSCSYVTTACIHLGEVVQIQIETDIQPGLPYFSIIGLPDKQIEEAKERVRAAIRNSGFTFPLGRITVNLSPSHVAKSGTGFDVGIALGILQANGSIPELSPKIWVFGELSLEGVIRPYPMAVSVLLAARQKGAAGCIVPSSNSAACSLVHECRVYKASHLKALAEAMCSGSLLYFVSKPSKAYPRHPSHYLFDEVAGQAPAKRVLEICLAGGHHLLMAGPPGVGKTMLAQSAVELMPDLSREHQLEVAQIYSHKNEHRDLLDYTPPFRTPHHSISVVNLIGGGAGVMPGEVSLAHRGLLFVDEFPEMGRVARESLRQPLQDGYVCLTRRGRTIRFPARCTVIAAQNNCPCGNLDVPGRVCQCLASDISRYRRALSQPILDRFGLYIQLESTKHPPEGHAQRRRDAHAIGERIAACHRHPMVRSSSGGLTGFLAPRELDRLFPLTHKIKAMVQTYAAQLELSARSMYSMRRVATTIALLRGDESVGVQDIEEAVQYRYKENFLG